MSKVSRKDFKLDALYLNLLTCKRMLSRSDEIRKSYDCFRLLPFENMEIPFLKVRYLEQYLS